MLLAMATDLTLTERGGRTLTAIRVNDNCVLIRCSESGHLATLFGKLTDAIIIRVMGELREDR